MLTDPEVKFTDRDIDLGAPAVYEVRGLTQEGRAQKAAEAVLFLSACSEDEVIELVGRVEGLYARVSTVTAPFGIEEVDVYGHVAVDALRQLDHKDAPAAIERINRTRRIVGAHKHRNNLPPLGTRHPKAD
jgi:hypothetical protein